MIEWAVACFDPKSKIATITDNRYTYQDALALVALCETNPVLEGRVYGVVNVGRIVR